MCECRERMATAWMQEVEQRRMQLPNAQERRFCLFGFAFLFEQRLLIFRVGCVS